jgi:hypothetical protein
MRDSNGLVELMRSRFPELNGLQIEAEDNYVSIGGSDKSTNVTIVDENDEWTVYTNEAHEHYENLDDALYCASIIASGKARSCSEFRNDVLAACWFEYEKGPDEFSYGGIAAMLSPFDREEWEALDGDVWKQIRITRKPNLSGTLDLESFEVVGNPSLHLHSELLDWLEKGLGSANRGMKWATTFDTIVVLQVPAGWRIVSDRKSEHNEWAPAGGGMLLRVSRFSKDAETLHRTRTYSAAKPFSVRHETPTDAPGYIQDRWVLLYGNAEMDYMVMVSLYSPSGEEAFHSMIRDQIAGAIDRTIYVPPTSQWDTKTVD